MENFKQRKSGRSSIINPHEPVNRLQELPTQHYCGLVMSSPVLVHGCSAGLCLQAPGCVLENPIPSTAATLLSSQRTPPPGLWPRCLSRVPGLLWDFCTSLPGQGLPLPGFRLPSLVFEQGAAWSGYSLLRVAGGNGLELAALMRRPLLIGPGKGGLSSVTITELTILLALTAVPQGKWY